MTDDDSASSLSFLSHPPCQSKNRAALHCIALRWTACRHHAAQLKRYTYGKHILVRLEKISGEKFV